MSSLDASNPGRLSPFARIAAPDQESPGVGHLASLAKAIERAAQKGDRETFDAKLAELEEKTQLANAQVDPFWLVPLLAKLALQNADGYEQVERYTGAHPLPNADESKLPWRAVLDALLIKATEGKYGPEEDSFAHRAAEQFHGTTYAQRASQARLSNAGVEELERIRDAAYRVICAPLLEALTTQARDKGVFDQDGWANYERAVREISLHPPQDQKGELIELADAKNAELLLADAVRVANAGQDPVTALAAYKKHVDDSTADFDRAGDRAVRDTAYRKICEPILEELAGRAARGEYAIADEHLYRQWCERLGLGVDEDKLVEHRTKSYEVQSRPLIQEIEKRAANGVLFEELATELRQLGRALDVPVDEAALEGSEKSRWGAVLDQLAAKAKAGAYGADEDALANTAATGHYGTEQRRHLGQVLHSDGVDRVQALRDEAYRAKCVPMHEAIKTKAAEEGVFDVAAWEIFETAAKDISLGPSKELRAEVIASADEKRAELLLGEAHVLAKAGQDPMEVLATYEEHTERSTADFDAPRHLEIRTEAYQTICGPLLEAFERSAEKGAHKLDDEAAYTEWCERLGLNTDGDKLHAIHERSFEIQAEPIRDKIAAHAVAGEVFTELADEIRALGQSLRVDVDEDALSASEKTRWGAVLDQLEARAKRGEYGAAEDLLAQQAATGHYGNEDSRRGPVLVEEGRIRLDAIRQAAYTTTCTPILEQMTEIAVADGRFEAALWADYEQKAKDISLPASAEDHANITAKADARRSEMLLDEAMALAQAGKDPVDVLTTYKAHCDDSQTAELDAGKDSAVRDAAYDTICAPLLDAMAKAAKKGEHTLAAEEGYDGWCTRLGLAPDDDKLESIRKTSFEVETKDLFKTIHKRSAKGEPFDELAEQVREIGRGLTVEVDEAVLAASEKDRWGVVLDQLGEKAKKGDYAGDDDRAAIEAATGHYGNVGRALAPEGQERLGEIRQAAYETTSAPILEAMSAKAKDAGVFDNESWATYEATTRAIMLQPDGEARKRITGEAKTRAEEIAEAERIADLNRRMKKLEPFYTRLSRTADKGSVLDDAIQALTNKARELKLDVDDDRVQLARDTVLGLGKSKLEAIETALNDEQDPTRLIDKLAAFIKLHDLDLDVDYDALRARAKELYSEKVEAHAPAAAKLLAGKRVKKPSHAEAFAHQFFDNKRAAAAFKDILDKAAAGDFEKLEEASNKFEENHPKLDWGDAAARAIEFAIDNRNLTDAVAWSRGIDEADYDFDRPSHEEMIDRWLGNLNDGSYDTRVPTADELRLVEKCEEDPQRVIDEILPNDLRELLGDHRALDSLIELANVFPELEHNGGTLKDSVYDLCTSALGHEDPKVVESAADAMVNWGATTADLAQQLKQARRNGDTLEVPPAFLLGIVKPERLWEAIDAAVLGKNARSNTDAEKRGTLAAALSEKDKLATIADGLNVSINDATSAMITGMGLGGWMLNSFTAKGVSIPGELVLAATRLQDGELRSHVFRHPAMKGTKARLEDFVLNAGWMPQLKVTFQDRVVPAEAQKHLVGRKKIISGDDVLRLYAAATAQPKWLAHDELVHHVPRPSVVKAIGKFVGLEDDEVERYFKNGGWGRLFHGTGQPLIFVDTEIYPGQIIREYLQVAGTAAPNVLNDFLDAQVNAAQKDAQGNPVPFPVSDTALDQVFIQLKNKLGLDFKDKEKPTDVGLEQLHEAKAKASLKEWFENRFFFTGKTIKQEAALLAPHVDENGPTAPVAQNTVGGAIESTARSKSFAQIVSQGDVAQAVKRDALSKAMLEHVPGPKDVIALKDGSLRLGGFLESVAEQVRAETGGDAAKMLPTNELKVDDQLIESMLHYAKNVEPLVAPPDPAAAAGAKKAAPKKKTALQKLEALDAPEDALSIMRSIFSKARAEKERLDAGQSPLGFSAHCRLQGNPGTGKTTVARIIVEGVRESGLLPEPKDKTVEGDILETTGRDLMRLAKEGKLEDFFLNKAHGRGVLLDEIYQIDLTSEHGRHVADFLLTFLENHRTDTIVFAAGYDDLVEKFFASKDSNPGFKSRFKHIAKFPDFTDAKLVRTMHKMTEEKGFTVSEAIVKRAIGHLTKFRGEGFGNARSVRNMVEQAIEVFLDQGGPGTGGELLAAHFFPEQNKPKEPSKARAALEKREGLKSVKAKFASIEAALAENQEREELGMKPLPISTHAAFLGNPGTGKTTVGEDWGAFLKEKKLLSKGDLIRVTREDLVGSHEGDTERKVRELLDRAKGCVLFIDEAYALFGDTYGNKAIDMLVGALKGDGTDDICVVMAGYTGPMEKMFDEANPGLARRVAQRFVFEDFDDKALRNIISSSATRLELKLPPEGLDMMLEQLSHERQRPNFGNAGSANNLLTAVGEAASTRKQKANLDTTGWDLKKKIEYKSEITLADVEAAIGLIKQRQAAETRQLKDLIGASPIKEWSKKLELSVIGAERRRAPRPPPPGVIGITGPRGCGKGAAAACIATELDRLKLLGGAVTKVVNARELIAGYLNQTVGQVNAMMKPGLGRVLVIRGVHELLDGGTDLNTAKEAISTMAKFIKENRGKMTIVFEGDATGHKLQKVLDMGLREHVQAVLEMKAATPQEATEYFARLLGGNVLTGDPEMFLDEAAMLGIYDVMGRLAAAPGWGSFSDVENFFADAKNANAERLGLLEAEGVKSDEAAWLTLTQADLEAALLNLLRTKGAGDGEVLEIRLPAIDQMGRMHFETPAAVNGVIGDFIVDTGANLVTITPEFATQCGIDWKTAQSVPVNTASGEDSAYQVTLPSINVGGLVAHQVKALVMNTPKMLLGMSFLKELEFTMVGEQMLLTRPGMLRNQPEQPKQPVHAPGAGQQQAKTLDDPRLAIFNRRSTVAVEKKEVAGAVDGAADHEHLKSRLDDYLYEQMTRLVADKKQAEAARDFGAARKAETEIKKIFDAVTTGQLTPDLLKKIQDELGIKADQAKLIAKEVADLKEAELERTRKIQAELEKKQKATEWVCSRCGNSNPGCPYNVKNNGIGNMGGYMREVPSS